ncbi:ATP-binding protein [Halobaculum marinum]|uniref:ATP-binding protein n=1 Tax=Halobaculum marinum TaxID=3031996 RepID=A0ABD5WWW9_9EURY|nr:ATP-binding protein [Halobaculum sp. DT55]
MSSSNQQAGEQQRPGARDERSPPNRSPFTNGRAKTGYGWGEHTRQSMKHPVGDAKSDAHQIGLCFGMNDIDVEAFTERHPKRIVHPDMLIHEKNPTRTKTDKGTDFLLRGERGCGKTTLLLTFARQLMRENDEIVVWRGREGSSGWLPYKHWTTVYLPANATVRGAWMPEVEDESDEISLSVDDGQELTASELERVVRDVVYYEDVFDLLDKLGERSRGTFNVVYPDPSFSGCQKATRESRRVNGYFPFVPRWEAEYDDDGETTETPLVQWWFAFWLARCDYGPFTWMTLLFDEGGDLIPRSASQSVSRLYDKLEMLRSIFAESRRRLATLGMAIHYEENLDPDTKREFKWRVHMPDGSANPVADKRGTHPVGMKGDIKMNDDFMSRYDEPGVGLTYSKKGFSKFRWDDVPDWPEDENRWLKVVLEEPDASTKRELRQRRREQYDGEDEATSELEYDSQVFGEWRNQHEQRLYVKHGSGQISVERGVVIEDLESEIDGLRFREDLRDLGDVLEVVMVEEASGDEIVVARVPAASSPFKSDAAVAAGAGR